MTEEELARGRGLMLRVLTAVTLMSGIIAAVLLGRYTFASTFPPNIVDTISVVGSVVSITALAITLIQVASIRRTSEATKAAVDDALDRIQDRLTIAEVSSAVKLIGEIRALMNGSEMRGAHLRLEDLQVLLSRLRQNRTVLAIVKDRQGFEAAMSDLGVSTVGLGNALAGGSRPVNPQQLSGRLSMVGKYLIDIESVLRFRKV